MSLPFTASVTLLPNAAPSIVSLCPSTSSMTAATSALRLKGAAHFVAINGPCKSQRHGTSLYLHAKRQVLSSNASAH
jgi:hypothetical protein